MTTTTIKSKEILNKDFDLPLNSNDHHNHRHDRHDNSNDNFNDNSQLDKLNSNNVILDDQSPQQPLNIENKTSTFAVEDLQQNQSHQPIEEIMDNNSSMISIPTSKFVKKLNVNKSNWNSYLDYKNNKDARKLLNILLNDLDNKKDTYFKEIAKSQRRLRKKTENDYEILKQSKKQLETDYDLLKKTTNDDLNVLRNHLSNANQIISDQTMQHDQQVSQLVHENQVVIQNIKNDHQIHFDHFKRDFEIQKMNEFHQIVSDNQSLTSRNVELNTRLTELERVNEELKAENSENNGKIVIHLNKIDKLQKDFNEVAGILKNKDDVIESLNLKNQTLSTELNTIKFSQEFQSLISSINPSTALLVVIIAYLLACIMGFVIDPIRIIMYLSA